MAYENKLACLKQLTTTEKDFSVSMKYFFDEIAENSEIDRDSKPLRSKKDFFMALLSPITQQYYDEKVQIVGQYLMEIKDKNFVHGVTHLTNGSMIVLYFFSDVLLGMAAIPSMTGITNFFRLNVFSDEREKQADAMTPTIPSTTRH
jgi:hypothetical protein